MNITCVRSSGTVSLMMVTFAVHILFNFVLLQFAFNALSLLIGHQEEPAFTDS